MTSVKIGIPFHCDPGQNQDEIVTGLKSIELLGRERARYCRQLRRAGYRLGDRGYLNGQYAYYPVQKIDGDGDDSEVDPTTVEALLTGSRNNGTNRLATNDASGHDETSARPRTAPTSLSNDHDPMPERSDSTPDGTRLANGGSRGEIRGQLVPILTVSGGGDTSTVVKDLPPARPPPSPPRKPRDQVVTLQMHGTERHYIDTKGRRMRTQDRRDGGDITPDSDADVVAGGVEHVLICDPQAAVQTSLFEDQEPRQDDD